MDKYEICQKEIIITLNEILITPHHPICDVIMKQFDPSFKSNKDLIVSDKIKSSYAVKTLVNLSVIENSLESIVQVLHMINVLDLMYIEIEDANNKHIDIYYHLLKSFDNIIDSFEKVKMNYSERNRKDMEKHIQKINDTKYIISKLLSEALAIDSYNTFMRIDMHSSDSPIEARLINFILMMNIFMNIYDLGLFNDLNNGFLRFVIKEAEEQRKALEPLTSFELTNALYKHFIETYQKFSGFIIQLKTLYQLNN